VVLLGMVELLFIPSATIGDLEVTNLEHLIFN